MRWIPQLDGTKFCVVSNIFVEKEKLIKILFVLTSLKLLLNDVQCY